MGEQLENWLFSEYGNYSTLFDNCPFMKTNKAINGRKPDFQFIINDDDGNQISNIIIEAKTESQYSQESNKKSNASHLSKLWIDQKNFNADYSILVSELEMTDNDFLIKKVNNLEYKNMYIIRPQYFIPFLALIKEFALKRNKIDKIDIQLQEKQIIINEFNIFKEKLIKDFCSKIEVNVKTILNSSLKIKKEALTIETKAAMILDEVIENIANKIEKYSIEKKVKTLKKLVE